MNTPEQKVRDILELANIIAENTELKRHLKPLIAGRNEFVRLRNLLQQKVYRLERHNALLRDVAKAAQWAETFGEQQVCPICKGHAGEGHSETCEYQAAVDGGAIDVATITRTSGFRPVQQKEVSGIDFVSTSTSSASSLDWLEAVKDIPITAYSPSRESETVWLASMSWASISETSFEDWDNEEDAIYDEL